ncbi:MAG: carboxypeptidase-like regulatory domain-containing protein [Myxococcaceae bacterium]|nr:carboxypeptidase-like regulatory domain-containing protein [Myxococcaceae bacterium]
MRDPSALRPSCFTITFDLGGRAAQVEAPVRRDDADAPRFLADDRLALKVGRVDAVAAGDGQRVSVELALENRSSASLGPQALAVSPPAARGLVVFDCGVAATDVAGQSVPAQAGAGFDGNGSSADGSPFDFVLGLPCGEAGSCSRYEVFPAPIAPGATTRPRGIDFELGAGATTLVARLGVLGDETGLELDAVSGRVIVKEGGPLEGARVSLAPASLTTATPATGLFQFTGVPRGVQRLLAEAPGCSSAELDLISPRDGLTIALDCGARRARVEGQVRIADGGVVEGVRLAVLPEGGAPLFATTGVDGRYRVDDVPVGTTGAGEVLITELPEGARWVASQTYQDLFAGGVAQVDFVLTPLQAPQAYEIISTWGPVVGGRVTLLLSADLTQLNVPSVNGVGADAIVGVGVRTRLIPGERLAFRSGGIAQGAGFDIGATNGTVPGQVYGLAVSINQLAGVQPLFRYEFDVLPGPATTVRTRSVHVEFLTGSGSNPVDLARRVRVIEGSLVLP